MTDKCIQRKGWQVTHSRDEYQSKTLPIGKKCELRFRFLWKTNTQFLSFRDAVITGFLRYDKKSTKTRNWSVLPSRRTPHFYHSKGDRLRLVWQGWSSLVCSRAETGTWRGWMDCPTIPTKTHAARKNRHLSHNFLPVQFSFILVFSATHHAIKKVYITFTLISVTFHPAEFVSSDKININSFYMKVHV